MTENEGDFPAAVRRHREKWKAVEEQLVPMIREATGTEQTDLGYIVRNLVRRSKGPKWPHPVFPRHEAMKLKRSIRSLRRDLQEFERKWIEDPPSRIPKGYAVNRANISLEECINIVDEVHAAAAQRRREVETFEGRKLTRRRNWRAYGVALEAALIFEALTGELPQFSKSKRDPYRVFVMNLFGYFNIRRDDGELVDLDEPMRWALERSEGESA